MERNTLDNLSDGISVHSQDRMSDDTDFLVGHNISFSYMNDSYLDAKSSTTTDIVYQQELPEGEELLLAGKAKSMDQKPFPAGTMIKNSPDKSKGTFMNSKVAGRQVNSSARYSPDIDELESIDHSDYERVLTNGRNAKDTLVNNGRRGFQNSSGEVSKSEEEIKSHENASPNIISNNWKYRSVHHSLEDELSFGKDVNAMTSGSFSDSFTEFDPKVREGEELLAKLLGRVTLNESLKLKTPAIKETINQNQDKIWKDSTQSDQSGPHNFSKKSSNQSVKPSRESYGLDGNLRAGNAIENGARSDVGSLYSDRSEQSKVSRSSSQRRSSHELLDTRSSNSQKFSNRILGYDEVKHNHGDRIQNGVESKRRDIIEDSVSRQIDSPRRSSGSSRHERSSSSASDRRKGSGDSLKVEPANEYVQGPRVFQSFDVESNDKSRSSSIEKQHKKVSSKSVNAEVATSTPHKANWPLSPIRKTVDLKLEESETLILKYENKLKELQLLIEQEMIRKEAILDEKTSAEEALIQIKKNIHSLEQLAEDHKMQTVSTRSELMELEQKRDDYQRVLNQVSEDLRKQKKELESLPKELKESNISTKIAMLQNERDDLKRECNILKEKCKDIDHLNNTNMDLMKKIRSLQEQFYNEQDSNREKLRKLREELESERRKAVEANIEQMTSLRKLREEAMDTKKADLDAAVENMEKEKQNEIESIKERYSHEAKSLQRRIEELEEENQRVVKSNNERMNKLQQQLENNHKRELENSIKRSNYEKQNEMAAAVQRHKRETEELTLEIKSKTSEIENLQALLKRQAESTRLLGEKLRSEAKEQISLAVEKERDTRLEELRKTELELEQVKGERDSLSSESNSELINKENENERLRNVINKLKKELDHSRQETYEVREEKMQAVSKTRSTMREEAEKMKAKLREMEKFQQTALLELNEEFVKTAAVTGGSYPQIKKNYSFDVDDSNPLSEALSTLRLSNNDLRKLAVVASKRKREDRRRSDESCDQSKISDNESNVEKSGTLSRSQTPERSQTPNRARTPERARTPDRAHTPDSAKVTLNGSGEESRSARILRHLQSRVRQLREGNESMKRSFGSDDGEYDADRLSRSNTPERSGDASFSNSSAETQRLESALKNAEEQAQKYAGLLSQKMSENTKLQKMLTQASKENIKLERLHSILQHKVATSGVSI